MLKVLVRWILQGSGKSELKPSSSKHVMTTVKDSHIASPSTPGSSSASSNLKCPICTNGTHPPYRCWILTKLPVQERREYVKSNRLCFSCMSPKHMIDKCQSKHTCRKCSKRHHTILHTDETSVLTGSSNLVTEVVTEDLQTQFIGLSNTFSTVLLGTAIGRVRDQCGTYHNVRMLFDNGSQVSAITTGCAAHIGLVIRQFRTEIVGFSQSPVSQVKGSTTCSFSPHHSSTPLFQCDDVIVLPKITSIMPAVQLPPRVRSRYQHLLLADSQFDTPAGINMLIGGDLFWRIIRSKSNIIHSPGLSSALDTHLGWIIVGPVSDSSWSPKISLTVTSTPSLDTMLHQFWTIEEPPAPKSPTTENELCEKWFINTTFRDPSGKFRVALPFRDKVLSCAENNGESLTSRELLLSHGLGDSQSLAMKRFLNLERRLNKDNALYEAYRRFMNEYHTLGHMNVATKPGRYFIPHHAVLRLDGGVSKLRVVFDASAPSTSGASLNDVLCTGPKLQTDIRYILQKSRLYRYVFTADIEKMYRQILIEPADRVYQHVFWRNCSSEAVQEYELSTVTYGVSSAPYLAIRCLHEPEIQLGNQIPSIQGILTDMTYVDDIVVGADTEEELCKKKTDIVALLKLGGCGLKKWTSNCPSVIQRVSQADRTQLLSFDPKDDCSVKVLGLHWDTRSATTQVLDKRHLPNVVSYSQLPGYSILLEH